MGFVAEMYREVELEFDEEFHLDFMDGIEFPE